MELPQVTSMGNGPLGGGDDLLGRALVVIVALPTGRPSSSYRPSAPVVAVALPTLTDAPSMATTPAALTTPDTVAAAAAAAVSTTSWVFVPAVRLTVSERGSKPGAVVVIVALLGVLGPLLF